MPFSASTHPVPGYEGTCCKWGFHLRLQPGWLIKSEKFLFVLRSLTWPHSWKKIRWDFNQLLIFCFPLGIELLWFFISQSFLVVFSKKSSFYCSCKRPAPWEDLLRMFMKLKVSRGIELLCLAALLPVPYWTHLQLLFPWDLCYLLGAMT